MKGANTSLGAVPLAAAPARRGAATIVGFGLVVDGIPCVDAGRVGAAR